MRRKGRKSKERQQAPPHLSSWTKPSALDQGVWRLKVFGCAKKVIHPDNTNQHDNCTQKNRYWVGENGDFSTRKSCGFAN
jgi:hypothetical protein